MIQTFTKDGVTYRGAQLSPANRKDILTLGPIEIYETDDEQLVAKFNTPYGPVATSAPAYILRDPTGTLFGIPLQDIVDYLPLP